MASTLSKALEEALRDFPTTASTAAARCEMNGLTNLVEGHKSPFKDLSETKPQASNPPWDDKDT